MYFFFFQAEDGIRDHCVTGVQTCALPIYSRFQMSHMTQRQLHRLWAFRMRIGRLASRVGEDDRTGASCSAGKIGRASCRERVEIAVVAVSLKKKREGGCRGKRKTEEAYEL